MIPLRFTAADLDAAHQAWGCNCGPGAIAAMLGLTLDEVRPFLGDFESKRYTNPTLMWSILAALRVPHTRTVAADNDAAVRPVEAQPWPGYGLCRIQWHGPWTRPGVPLQARYRHTHWIGVQRGRTNPRHVGIFDINARCEPDGELGWTPASAWAESVVPWLLERCVPRASGGWHITHVVTLNIARWSAPRAPAEAAGAGVR